MTASPRQVSETLGAAFARDQRFGLRSRPIVDCHDVPRLHEVRSHAGTLLPESDEANVHGLPFLMRGGAQCPSLLRSVRRKS